MRCNVYGCGSYAINENLYDRSIGIDSDLCDVHYWQKRATDFEAQLEAVKQSNQTLFQSMQAQELRLEAAKKDAERYQALRRGQKWSVIDGIGDTLRAEGLDEAIDDAAIAEGKA